MIALTKGPQREIAGHAAYWLAFRETNDWYTLVDWKKTGIDTERQRVMASMKVKIQKMRDEHLPLEERMRNAQDLAKNAIGGQMLLGLAAENKLPDPLFAAVAGVIFDNPDLAVRIQAGNYFAVPGSTRPLAIAAIAKLDHDPGAGKMVFRGKCASCHRIKDAGQDIGPDLTGIKTKFDREALLDAIVHPNAGIVFGYEPWTITTQDGETRYGFLVADGEATVVLKDMLNERHVIATKDIRFRKKSGQSLMPSPTVLGLTDQNLADVSEYLLTLP
jgi:putative heme-binding domain-containing protein